MIKRDKIKKLNCEFEILRKWLQENGDLPFFSDLKLRKLGFTFVGSNIYRYALILNKLKKHLNVKKKCIDFGSYPGQMQEIIYGVFNVKFDLSGLHFGNDFKSYFKKYTILDFDFENEPEEIYKNTKESYDIATSFNIIEHMEYPNKLLDSINFYTKKDGLLMLTTDNISTLKNIKRMLISGKSPNESLIKSKIFYNGEWRPHVRIFSKDELEFLLNYSGFQIMEHSYFNLRAREYRIEDNNIIRKKLSFKASILEFIENYIPFFRDHHFIIAKKTVDYDELNDIRMLPTNSTDKWISYRYDMDKYDIFKKTKTLKD